MELADRAGLTASAHLLDVGCGIGGSARFLAGRYGCQVTGIDLTAEHIATGIELTRFVGLSGRVTLQRASALDLPFADASFDLAWTEHVQMNIADKRTFYGQIARVLRPGGRLLFHDVFQGPAGPPLFPLPWASEPAISHLATPEAVRQLLRDVGLAVGVWEDTTDRSLAWFQTMAERQAQAAPSPLGPHVVMGDRARLKLDNLRRGLGEGRLVVVQAVATRS